MSYVPLWTDILDKPNWKILDLPPEVFRFWCLCMLAAQKFDFVEGYLPDDRTLCAWIHMPVTELGHVRDMAVTSHVLSRSDDGRYRIHDWQEWRDVKDARATIRKRSQREREKALKANDSCKSRQCHDEVTAMSHDVTAQLTTDNKQQTTKESPILASEPIDPEVTRVANMAAEIGGDISWAFWVERHVKMKVPLDWIETAIRKAVGKGIVTQDYAAGILKNYAKSGGPTKTEVARMKPEPKPIFETPPKGWRGI